MGSGDAPQVARPQNPALGQRNDMKLKLGDVFKTVGLPPFTYVKPPYYPEVRADMEQAGRHILIEGPSGIGKSCVVWKAIEELGWVDGLQFRYMSCRDNNAPRIFD